MLFQENKCVWKSQALANLEESLCEARKLFKLGKYKEAMPYFLAGADPQCGNSPEARGFLAILHAFGLGCTRNLKEGKRLLLEAMFGGFRPEGMISGILANSGE